MNKHPSTTQPTIIAVTDKHGDVLMSNPSERVRLRAVTASQDQRQARARREALQIIAAAERLTETPAPAPTPPDLNPLEIWMPESSPFGRIAAMVFMVMAAFIAGLAVGRL